MFFLVVFSVWGLILLHVFWRTQSLMQLQGWARVAFGLGLFLAGFCYVGVRIWFAGQTDTLGERTLTYFSALVIGFIATLWTLIALFDLASLAWWFVRGHGVGHESVLLRQQIGGGLWVTAVILTLIGWFIGHSTPAISRVQVSAPGVEDYRFAVISDSHLGVSSSSDQWERTLQATRDQDPDVILIPGDLIDDASPRALEQVARIREAFPAQPIFVTTGNHDLYSGDGHFAQICSEFNFHLLSQKVEQLGPGLQVAGIDDAHLIDPAQAITEIRSSLAGTVLLLSHRPAVAHLLSDRPQTLVLSGHTHGGQTLPMVFLVSLANGRFRAGLYQVEKSFLYVSRGTGVWGPPIRLLAGPEIVIIDVVRRPEFTAGLQEGE